MGKSVLYKGALALQRGIINSVLFSALIIFFAFFEAQGQDFSRATGGYNWSFPRDHGHHSGYQSEWWYFTGQLYADGAEPFVDQPLYGFQLTFFRRVFRNA